MTDPDATHLVVCKSAEALHALQEECCIIGEMAEGGEPMRQGDALVARDTLLESGFEWGKDFFLKKV